MKNKKILRVYLVAILIISFNTSLSQNRIWERSCQYISYGYFGLSGNGEILTKIEGNHVVSYRLVDNEWVNLGDSFELPISVDEYAIKHNYDGTTLLLGSLSFVGQVDIYKWTENAWVKKGETIVGDGNDHLFGSDLSCDITGDIISIGAFDFSSNSGLPEGPNNTGGYVKVFSWQEESWTQLGQTIYGDHDMSHASNVVMNSTGTTIAIGAPGNIKNSSGDYVGEAIGQVKVFDFLEGEWELRGTPFFGENQYDAIGQSLDLDSLGKVLCIAGRQRAVKVYSWKENNWELKGAEIDSSVNGVTSLKISSSGDRVIFGNQFYQDGAGVIRTYDWLNNAWVSSSDSLVGNKESGRRLQSHMNCNNDGTLLVIEIDSSEFVGKDKKIATYFNILQSQQISNNQAISICEGETFIFGNQLLNESGVFTETFPSVNDSECDSIVHLSLSVEECKVLSSLSEEIEQMSLVVYPNPVTDFIQLDFNNQFNGELKLFNLSGHLVKDKRLNNVQGITLNLSGLISGIYILSITSENGNIHLFRLIKNSLANK